MENRKPSNDISDKMMKAISDEIDFAEHISKYSNYALTSLVIELVEKQYRPLAIDRLKAYETIYQLNTTKEQ